jgi:hypothetical protein
MMMMMTVAGFSAQTMPAPAHKSGQIFRPVAQTAIGTLEPLSLEGDELAAFLYPNTPNSQAPFTTSVDANLNTVILTGEDAYKSMVADKVQSKESSKHPNGLSLSSTVTVADVKDALYYSKHAKLLDLTPMLDVPAAFVTENARLLPPPEKRRTDELQAAVLKQQQEKLTTAREDKTATLTDLSTGKTVTPQALVSMNELKTIVAEEQKAVPALTVLLPKLEANYHLQQQQMDMQATPKLVQLQSMAVSVESL